MQLTSGQREFIESNPSAAMITIGGDGYAKAVRVGVAIVDGNLWSSGTLDRLRTWRLRQDPRCTLFVFGSGYDALTLETVVTIIEGGGAVPRSVAGARIGATVRPPACVSTCRSRTDGC